MIIFLKDIPPYLQESQLYSILVEQNFTEYDIPIKYYKHNDDINDLDSFVNLFEVYNYWGCKQYPKNFIDYYYRNLKIINDLYKDSRKLEIQFLQDSILPQLKGDIKQEWSERQFSFCCKIEEVRNNYREMSKCRIFTHETYLKNFDYSRKHDTYLLNREIDNYNKNFLYTDFGDFGVFEYLLLSSNPNPNFSFILQNLDKPWNWKLISKYISWEIFLQHYDNPKIPWNYSWLTSNREIDAKYVFDHPTKGWNFIKLSSLPYIPFSFFVSYPQYKYDYGNLSYNWSIDCNYVEQHPEYNWCYTTLSNNGSITLEKILNHPLIPWNREGLSKNPNITLSFIKEYPNENPIFKGEWKWDEISSNDAITWETIKNNFDQPWIFSNSENSVSDNTNIDWEIVYENVNLQWNYDSLFNNDMTLAYQRYLKNKLHEYGF